MADDGQISALERLAKLRDSGGLTEQEYEKEKAKLLSGSDAPFYRRLWFVVLLTVLILTFPIALLILLTGPVYRKADGTRVPIRNRTRYIYAGALGVWLAAAVINMTAGLSISSHWKRSADPTVASSDKITGTDDASQKVAASDQQQAPEACDSSDAADQVKDAIENGPVSKLVQVKMEDFGHPKELMFDKKKNARYCEADTVLNTGETAISYRFFFGPSGSQMIEVKEGKDAFGTEAMKIRASILSQYSPTIQARANGEIPLDGPVPANDSASANGNPLYLTYVNARFGFSVQYPPGLLTMQRAPDNDDGRTFKSADRKAIVLAFGRYLTDGETPETIAKNAEANCPNHHASYRVVKSALVALSCQIAETIRYQKTLISGDTAVTLDASYPTSEKFNLDSVVGHIASSMNVQK